LFFKLPQSFEQIDLNKVKVIMEENLSRIRRLETMNNKCCEATSSGPWKKKASSQQHWQDIKVD
jgi:hypothetical protein